MSKALSIGALSILAGFASSNALAATAVVDALGGSVQMQSHSIGSVFTGTSPNFVNADLVAMNNALNADGVVTEGKVTALLLDTASDGLAWAVLVDGVGFPKVRGNGNGSSNMLEMSTTGNATHMQFINDAGGDLLPAIPPTPSFQTVQGFFTWNGFGLGDGFAWANLLPDDTFSFDFFNNTGALPTTGFPGLTAIMPFQFASWDSALAKWVVIDTGDFTANNQFSYSVRVIPIPQASLLGLIGFAGVGSLRRRKLA